MRMMQKIKKRTKARERIAKRGRTTNAIAKERRIIKNKY